MEIYSSQLSPALDIGIGFYLLVTAVLSMAGNVLVLITAYKRSSSIKPPELLSVNLAVTDLGAAITMYPLSMVSAWSHRWLGGEATCVYYGLMGFFFGVASIMNLTVMAIVRLIVTLDQKSTREKISRRTVKILCAWIWTYALIWALFPIVGWGQYGLEPFGLSCSLAWGKMKEDGFTFVFSMFISNLALPSVIIICCYFGISFKMFFRCRNSISHGHQIPSTVKMHRRMLIIAVLISAGFLGCWAPYGIVSLWFVFRDASSLPPEVTLLPCMFAKSSTIYNPLIYYAFSKSFKREVKRLGCLCGGGSNVGNASNDAMVDSVHMVGDQRKATRSTENRRAEISIPIMHLSPQN